MNNKIGNTDKTNLENNLVNDKKYEKNSEVRKRIDDLIEKKRLKELLDDSDDWEL